MNTAFVKRCYDTVQDEGGAPLPHRGILNFVGSGVVATDDAGGERTQIAVAGGGGTPITPHQDIFTGPASSVLLPYAPLGGLVVAARNGIAQLPVSPGPPGEGEYVLAGSTITITLLSGDQLVVTGWEL